MIASLPLNIGVAVFGLLYGIMARQVGFTPWEAWSMSLIVHAGSAQFAALGMWEGANAIAIILTTLVINLRHLLMGASLAPYLHGISPLWKAWLALWMSDESYALTIAEYKRGKGSQGYFFGANLGIYITWTISGLFGAILGSRVPNPGQYGLDLIFPLGFLGLLTSFLENRVDIAVALLAGGLGLAGACFLPGKWYVIAAGLLAGVLGILMEEIAACQRS
jgi:4-azaleucine resistance transporter AzlC